MGSGDALDVADPDVADGERLPHRRQTAQRSRRAGPAVSFSIRQPCDVADQHLGRRVPVTTVQTLPVDLVNQLHLHGAHPSADVLNLADQVSGVGGVDGVHPRDAQGIETRADLAERNCGRRVRCHDDTIRRGSDSFGPPQTFSQDFPDGGLVHRRCRRQACRGHR